MLRSIHYLPGVPWKPSKSPGHAHSGCLSASSKFPVADRRWWIAANLRHEEPRAAQRASSSDALDGRRGFRANVGSSRAPLPNLDLLLGLMHPEAVAEPSEVAAPGASPPAKTSLFLDVNWFINLLFSSLYYSLWGNFCFAVGTGQRRAAASTLMYSSWPLLSGLNLFAETF